MRRNNKIILYIILIVSLFLNVIYFTWIKDLFKNNESNFQSIVNYNLWKNNNNVLKQIDNDFRTVLSKHFWKIKLDKNMFLKDTDTYHLFYFSERVPNLNSVIDLILPEIRKKWYIEQSLKDSRTYKFNKNINGKEYSIIFNVLSYHLDNENNNNDNEDMWVFMLYIKKL